MNIVILGLGNPLWTDEGIGVHVVSKLFDYPFSEQVEVIDGGTDGLNLIPVIEAADKLVIVDAVRTGAHQPGDVVVMRGDEIPMEAYHKMSQHQFGFAEALGICKFNERLPEEIVLIGVVPQSIEWGVEVSQVVEKALPAAVEAVLRQVEEWEAAFHESA